MTQQHCQLARLRRMFDYRQRDLAERVGVSRQFISLIELGLRRPNLRMKKRIADSLEMPVEDVFPDEPDESKRGGRR
jgi:DNA-binding XRE family transcriptional regulator